MIYFAMYAQDAKNLIKEMNDKFLYKVPTVSGHVTSEEYINMTNSVVRFWQFNVPFITFLMSVMPLVFTFKTGR